MTGALLSFDVCVTQVIRFVPLFGYLVLRLFYRQYFWMDPTCRTTFFYRAWRVRDQSVYFTIFVGA
jgi:hypothetical protein